MEAAGWVADISQQKKGGVLEPQIIFATAEIVHLLTLNRRTHSANNHLGQLVAAREFPGDIAKHFLISQTRKPTTAEHR